jgi:hypothetical protein
LPTDRDVTMSLTAPSGGGILAPMGTATSDQTLAVVEKVRRFAMSDPASPWSGARLRQHGEMRLGPDRPWMPFQAEQRFDGNGVNFRWEARVRMAPFLTAHVVDSFEHGAGGLVARVLGLIPVARARGPETDVAEAMRGLAELPWRPFAFGADGPVTFEVASFDVLRATFDDGRTRATVDLDVGGDGSVLGASAASRPRLVGKTVVNTAWSGVFRDYRDFDGVRVPSTAEVTWHLPEGPFTYWRGRVTEFRLFR